MLNSGCKIRGLFPLCQTFASFFAGAEDLLRIIEDSIEDSILLLLFGWLSPETMGDVFQLVALRVDAIEALVGGFAV